MEALSRHADIGRQLKFGSGFAMSSGACRSLTGNKLPKE
jgi:hypothetical protein